MKKTLLLSALFFFSLTANAQLTKIWDHRFGGNDRDDLNKILTAKDGGFLLCGYSYSSASGNKTTTMYGEDDFWTIRTDSIGNKLWERDFGGTADDELYDAVETTDGGFLLCGYLESSTTGNVTAQTHGIEDFYIVKIDSFGTKLWDKTFGGSSEEYLEAVCTTSDGGYLIGGFSNSGSSGNKTQFSYGGYDFWVVKIDANGTKLWDEAYGGSSNDKLYALYETSDHGFLLAGVSYSGISGNKSVPSWGSGDYWMVKIDSNGNKLWDQRFGTTSDESFFGGCSNGSDGIILAGTTSGGISGDKTQSSWGSSDYWLVNVDSTGTKIWDKRFGGSGNEPGGTWFQDVVSGSIMRTDEGNYLVCSSSTSGVSGNKTHANLASQEPWMILIDSVGNVLLDNTTLTATNNGSVSSGIAAMANDGGFIVGTSTTSGIGGDVSGSAYGYNDFFIAKYVLPFAPIAAMSASDTAVCEGECISFANMSVNYPSSLHWSFPGGTPATSSGSNPVVCYNTTGSFDVTLIATNFVGADTLFFPSYINVYPQIGSPTISQMGNVLTCNTTASSYQWYFNYSPITGATNQSYTANASGFYSVKVWNAYGCAAVSTVLNFILNAPYASFSVSDSNICQSTCLDFFDLSLNSPTSWSWSFPGASPNSSTLQNPTNICYGTAGIYQVSLVATNSFGSSTASVLNFITVSPPPPAPGVQQSNDTLFCMTTATSYQWYFNGNLIYGATDSFYVATGSGSYTVEIIGSNGCTSSTIINVTGPAPAFSAQDSTICEKLCTQFSDLSNNDPISWQWIFDGGIPPTSTDQNPFVCYNVPGVYNVSLITFDGSDYDTLQLSAFMTVFPTPITPVITVTGDTLICSIAYSYQWLFNSVDIPGATNQSYISTQPGTYTVITTNEDGCSSQQTIFISGLEEEVFFGSDEYIISPNPGDGLFTIRFSKPLNEAFKLTVRDLTGRLMMESAFEASPEMNYAFDLKPFSDGVYMIALQLEKRIFISKIVKQH